MPHSDDRNAGTVSQRIKNALDAGSGLRSKGKPTCVVIDEIDGSAGGDMVRVGNSKVCVPLSDSCCAGLHPESVSPDSRCPGEEELKEAASNPEETDHLYL
jgi:hypothetical protein